jgi:MSHA pilin protein MshD
MSTLDLHNRLQRGFGLLELVMFIVIISVALGGILLAMNTSSKNSADPLIEKQALAIADSLLEEVLLMPFTFCDPDDASAVTATSPTVGGTGCNATVEAMGPEAGESRGNVSTPFDNVNDYNGFHMSGTGMVDIAGNPIAGLERYTANVTVTASALNNVAAGESLLVTVQVTRDDGHSVTLSGYRTRFAPRDL